MKQTLAILSAFVVLSSSAMAADEKPEKLNLWCSGEGKIAHDIRIELTRATKDMKCSAIAVDGTTLDVSPVTVNSDWDCEVTKLSETKTLREELIQMKVTTAKGVGGEAGMHLRFETLRIVVDTISGDGGGIATTLEKLHTRITCKKDSPGLVRYEP